LQDLCEGTEFYAGEKLNVSVYTHTANKNEKNRRNSQRQERKIK